MGLEADETMRAPKRLLGNKSLEKLANVTYKPGKLVVRSKAPKRKTYDPDVDDDPYGDGVDNELTGAFYKQTIFWELKTYHILYFRHCVDVMHTDKNVMEHILETIFDFGNKSMKSRNAMDGLNELGLHCGQWTTSKPGSTVAAKPMFVLSKPEKESFCKILKDLKFPSGFSSNLSNNVNIKNSSLSNFKSHDYIMEYLLPVCIQHAFPKHPELRRALHPISLYFRLLCSKVLSKSVLQESKFMVAEAMCVLEKLFPASFFDINVHLTVHLADEALLCGPVRYRWMYPFERAMKEFKNNPNNKRYIEGSIKENNLINEAVTYAMEHTSNPRDGNHQASWEAFLGEESEYSDVGPLGKKGTKVTLSYTQFIQIQRWVLFRCNPDGLADYYRYFHMLCFSHVVSCFNFIDD